MNIGVLGTGIVGRTIGSKLVSLGHEVTMGSRTAGNEKATVWAKEAGQRAHHSDFAQTAAFGEIIFNCTSGAGALAALHLAGENNLRDKVLVDISNPLDFSQGMPPRLEFRGEDSLGERIQRAFPNTKVVKTLNTVTAAVMVDPSRLPGDHDIFVCGNDADAKAQVSKILSEWFGWGRVTDLGDISGARGTEAYLLFWLRLMGSFKSADFNVRVVHSTSSKP